ncbi:transposase, IS605 OrfB family, central region [Archaeoglobus sulfaticallidus PM70-1]|uniref:Transposase, IS605 OrfB family, central region n=1 Tax=Archaeoglobus sulfaticallidus PM70-1 TaxID=387631 RepID=N0BH09_9EURY|nr:RNA-guided endonuclease TnpB family protein [Archaeoglobus sulfaticallidus]AGK61557.1 transposase, IS605 OrfB family, central region [Archaeoglobus sulfaticallidus PM70-1]
MLISYRFRIYPSKTVQAKLNEQLELCRWLYNRLLSEVNKARKEGRRIRREDTQSLIVRIKREEKPELSKVYSKVLQMVNYQLRSNISSLNELRKKGVKVGWLRYKTSPNSFKTLNFNQSGFKIDFDRKKLSLSKVGDIPIRLHRSIGGKIKGVIIKRTKSGKWYAIVQAEVDKQPLPPTGRAIGIDVGITHFCVDSDGNYFEHPKYLDRTLEKIKKVQKQLSRKQKGSKNREKVRIGLAKLYEKLENQRNDFLHKLSRYYVNNYDIMVVEDLNVKEMAENGSSTTLNRHITDSAWSKFVRLLCEKAERAARTVVKVNPKNTSKRCAMCGYIVNNLKLHDRTFTCPICGWEADRDYNASLNILDVGMGRSRTPVEGEPLPCVISYREVIAGQVLSMKQEVPSVRAE